MGFSCLAIFHLAYLAVMFDTSDQQAEVSVPGARGCHRWQRSVVVGGSGKPSALPPTPFQGSVLMRGMSLGCTVDRGRGGRWVECGEAGRPSPSWIAESKCRHFGGVQGPSSSTMVAQEAHLRGGGGGASTVGARVRFPSGPYPTPHPAGSERRLPMRYSCKEYDVPDKAIEGSSQVFYGYLLSLFCQGYDMYHVLDKWSNLSFLSHMVAALNYLLYALIR